MDSEAEMFRPPIARGMRALDRAFFQKAIPLKAARVLENKNISKIRSQLERSRDALALDRIQNVLPDPEPNLANMGKKCIALRPEVKIVDPETSGNQASIDSGSETSANGVSTKTVPWPHSPVLTELVQQNLVSVVPYTLHLSYDYWTYYDIMSAILPLEAHDEIPQGFAQVGHIAHLNLRENYLPYKRLIAEVLLDKAQHIRTVINKTDDVGHENEFRTFQYEILAGEDDMLVELKEAHCTFQFDYSKVYWNTRLQTEHTRLVDLFQPGEAVCDVMAGIGPFAVPAGKKGVFVWANDLNPDSYVALKDAIGRNKVERFVRGFNMDGWEFIRFATRKLLDDQHEVTIKEKRSRNEVANATAAAATKVDKTIIQPRTFQHFVLNLPASALTFLGAFIGLYNTPSLRARLPPETKMPLIHVYCFGGKDELNKSASINSEENSSSVDSPGSGGNAMSDICSEISRQLDYDMELGNIDEVGGVEVYDVRDVAPKKRMFCASFRLPESVAFRVE